MKRAIRLSALLMAGMLSVGALSGCSQQSSSSSSAGSAVSESTPATEAPAATEQPAETAAPSATEEPADASESATATDSASGSQVLVVYYSATGNTEAVAQTIAEATGGDLFAITPAEPYTDDDLNWTDENSRVSQEYADESLRDVALATATLDNWDSYDTVFIGYPIWWGIAAWPTSSFVAANDFTGKTVIPF